MSPGGRLQLEHVGRIVMSTAVLEHLMAEVCAVAAGTGQEGARRYLSVPGQLSTGRHQAVERLRETANDQWAEK